MTLMEKVRQGIAIDSIFQHETIVYDPTRQEGDRTITLKGAAHQAWVKWRRTLWLVKP